jgi:hypothetical protein
LREAQHRRDGQTQRETRHERERRLRQGGRHPAP